MRDRKKQRNKVGPRVGFMECCSRVCDERCRAGSVRDRVHAIAPTGIPRVVP